MGSSGSLSAPGLIVASRPGRSGSGRIRTTGSYPWQRIAVRIVNSAAPQLISSSRPAASLTASLRAVSAFRPISSPVTAKVQGWVLCTEGASRPASTAASSACFGERVVMVHLQETMRSAHHIRAAQ
ncbi:hypothetical protein GCM10010176_038040 [Nonomuraea spiralis]|nr:hypothetical protein GCM10010176_038040 [Nonomuraea spiralis]